MTEIPLSVSCKKCSEPLKATIEIDYIARGAIKPGLRVAVPVHRCKKARKGAA